MRFATFAIAAMSAIVAVSGAVVPAAELEARQSCELTSCVTSLTSIITGAVGGASGLTSLPLTCVTSLLSLNPTTILADCATILLATGGILPAACTACVPLGSLPLG
ncbi:hypothetical protein BDQ17DRAFT_1365167, partial [Cyathus striatus]